MRRPETYVLCTLLLLAGLPFLVQGDAATWNPSAWRVNGTQVTSRGLLFNVTITFEAPNSEDAGVFLNEGNFGMDWFKPGLEGGYHLFKVVGYLADPGESWYSGRSQWIWLEGDYDPGQTMSVTYTVKVSPSVEYGTYEVEGWIGTCSGDEEDEDETEEGVETCLEEWEDEAEEDDREEEDSVIIAGDSVVEVRPPTLTPQMGRPLYARGERIDLTADVLYGDGSLASGGIATARFNRTGDEVLLEEMAGQPGVYAGEYQLSPLANVGLWTVEVSFSDDMGNTADSNTSFEVIFAVFEIEVHPAKPSFGLDEVIVIMATATFPDRRMVTGANLTATFNRTEETLLMYETDQGVYEVHYGPVNETGLWQVQVTGSFHSSTGEAVGAFEVLPLVLTVDAWTSSESYSRLEKVTIHAEPKKDGTPFQASLVTAEVEGMAEPLELEMIDFAVYEIFFILSENFPLGITEVVIFAYAEWGAGSTNFTFTVQPTMLSVDVAFDAKDYQRADTISVSVAVSYVDGRLVGAPEGGLILEPTGEFVELSSQEPGLLIASYAIPITAPVGTWRVDVDVRDPYGNSGAGNGSVTVVPAVLSVSLTFDAQAYQISETVSVRVKVSYADGTPVEAPEGILALDPLGISMGLSLIKPGLLTASYVIASGAPIGTWEAKVRVHDPYENSGGGAGTLSITPAQFTVDAFTKDFSVPRLTRVVLRALVKYPAGWLVEGASATIHWSEGQTEMFEDPAGVYVAALTPPRDFALGRTELVVKVRHRDGIGQGLAAIVVSTAALDIEASLDRKSVTGGDSVLITAVVKYPDGEKLVAGTVLARIRDDKGAVVTTLALSYDSEDGSLKVEWATASDSAAGIYDIEIQAQDPYGNEGSGKVALNVQRSSILSLYLANPWAVGLTVLAVLLLAALVTSRFRTTGEKHEKSGR